MNGLARSRLGLAAAVLLATACERGGAAKTAPAQPALRTVVLATIDTWRRDAAGFLGAPSPSPTPFLDGLAVRGLIAVDAMAPVPLTGPSHWSILSGRWPWRDDMRVNGDEPRAGRGPTLPEILRDAGWRTGAFVSCSVLEGRFGFAAGFEHFDDDFHGRGGLADIEMPERRGDATLAAALDWLGEQRSNDRIFLWVHLFDPHFPYVPPGGPLPGEHGSYRGEVAFADAQLARLASGLEALGRPLEQSLWVVGSDHGEGLGDHGESSHGLILHGATTRIPLLLAGASVPAGRREGLSSTVDILPTLLGRLGIAAPESDGIDLVNGSPPRQRAVPLESLMGARAFGLAPVRGLRYERWLWESSPADHLWDLRVDPEEERDLGQELADRVEQLRGIWRQLGVPEAGAPQARDRETVEKLRALGYLATGSNPGEQDVRSVGIEAAELRFQVQSRLKRGDFAGAEIHAARGLERFPRFLDLWIDAGFTAAGIGNLPEAERRFRNALALDPDYGPARLNLANVLLQERRLEAAEVEYRKVLEDAPDDPYALYNLGALLADLDRKREAAAHWRRFANLYPAHPRAAGVRAALAEWSESSRPD